MSIMSLLFVVVAQFGPHPRFDPEPALDPAKAARSWRSDAPGTGSLSNTAPMRLRFT